MNQEFKQTVMRTFESMKIKPNRDEKACWSFLATRALLTTQQSQRPLTTFAFSTIPGFAQLECYYGEVGKPDIRDKLLSDIDRFGFVIEGKILKSKGLNDEEKRPAESEDPAG